MLFGETKKKNIRYNIKMYFYFYNGLKNYFTKVASLSDYSCLDRKYKVLYNEQKLLNEQLQLEYDKLNNKLQELNKLIVNLN
jgi:hypothetical protein